MRTLISIFTIVILAPICFAEEAHPDTATEQTMTQTVSSDALAERIQFGRLSEFNSELFVPTDSPGFFGSLVPAFKVGVTGQVFRSIFIPRSSRVEPGFGGLASLDKATRDGLLDGIADPFRLAFSDARSLDDAKQIRKRVLEIQESVYILAEVGIGFRILGAFVDPIRFAIAAVFVLMCKRRFGTILIAAGAAALGSEILMASLSVVPGRALGSTLVLGVVVGLAHAGLVYWLRGLRKKNGTARHKDQAGS